MNNIKVELPEGDVRAIIQLVNRELSRIIDGIDNAPDDDCKEVWRIRLRQWNRIKEEIQEQAADQGLDLKK